MPPVPSNGTPPGASTTLALSSFSDSTPVLIDAADQPLSMTVDDVLKYVAPGAPRPDALMFLLTCKQLRLNPLAKEAFLVPTKDKWVTIISKQGYLRAAQRHGDYAGHDAGIVAQPYDPTKVKAGQPPPYTGPPVDCEGSLLPSGHLLVGGWAKVWRKGFDRPIVSRVSVAEYGKNTPGPWTTLTATMIRKVALVHAIREAFALGGYDEAEMPMTAADVKAAPPWQTPVGEPEPYRVPSIVHQPIPTQPLSPAVKPTPITGEMVARMRDLIQRAGMSDYQLNQALTKRGVDRLEDLDVISATTMANKLEAVASEREWEPIASKARTPEGGEEASVETHEVPVIERPVKEVKAREKKEKKAPETPRKREPGDDDEPFDDVTKKVIHQAFERIDADQNQAEIDAELDRPVHELAEAKDAVAARNRTFAKP